MSTSLFAVRQVVTVGRCITGRAAAVQLQQSVWKTTTTTRQTTRSLATGTRGSRGHGWYVNYRAGKGGRHLQGEYYDRDMEECKRWNDSILELGSEQVYLDVVAEPRSSSSASAVEGGETTKQLDDLASLTGERHRLVMEIATEVMPETTRNFLDLCQAESDGYRGSLLYRIEKNVGICGGDVLTNTGKTGKAASGNPLTTEIETDPLALWHLEGAVTMLVPKVGEVDSRFVLCTETSQHLDGINRAFGRMNQESVEIIRKWQSTLLTNKGVPTSVDLVVVDCGLLDARISEEAA